MTSEITRVSSPATSISRDGLNVLENGPDVDGIGDRAVVVVLGLLHMLASADTGRRPGGDAVATPNLAGRADQVGRLVDVARPGFERARFVQGESLQEQDSPPGCRPPCRGRKRRRRSGCLWRAATRP